MPTSTPYNRISRLNHWIIAFAMIGMLGFGLYLEYGGLPREAKGPLIGIHRSIGVLVLIYGSWRVLWRVIQGFPSPASQMPRWQTTVSKVVHWALLIGVLVMPLSGIAFTVFRGRPVEVFGWFTIPAQTEMSWIVTTASVAHQYVGIGLCLIVALHVAAAMKHHFIDRDETLTRMVRGRPSID
jgi:cytochrome b561